MNRDSIIIGAARFVFNAPAGAATFYTPHENVTKLPLKPQTFKVAAEGIPIMSTRLKDMTPIIDVTPDGRWNAAIIAALWPYAQAAKNQRIFTNTDCTLLAHTQETHLLTCASVAVYKQPQINFSPVKSLIGPAQIALLRANGVAWDTANSLLTYALTGGTFVDSTFAASSIKTQTYLGNWGTKTGFTSIETFEDSGFVFTPILSLKPVLLTGARTNNYMVTEIGAQVSFRPANAAQADMLSALAFQNSGCLPGTELGQGAGADFTITGADGINYCIVKNAVAQEGGFAFGGEPRNDMMSFVSQPILASGVFGPAFVLAAS
ncbi:MAG: hypothetical protein ABSH15_04280 [Verrucomicrobiota bacterium]|jgi:hypothetical protein